MGIKTTEKSLFLKNVEEMFTFLKTPTTFHQLFSKAIPLPNDLGSLVPIAQLHEGDDETIHLLAKWREINTFAFPTRFKVTFEGTREWLRSSLLDSPHRLLFLLLDKHGKAIGHLGLDQPTDTSIHIDNVIRGSLENHPGIMTIALQTLMEWTQKTLFPDRLLLNVLADNVHAVRFYEKNGFVTDSEIPLTRVQEGELTRFIPTESENPDKIFLTMRYVPKKVQPDSMILTAGPSISAKEVSYACDAAQNGWNLNATRYIDTFEKEFAGYLGSEHALATSSCHGALHLALKALEIGPGDEVIVPDISWIAAAAAITYVGATPVFVDIDPNTLTLEPIAARAAITPKTRCIMPVHLYGHPCDMDAICDIANEYNLYIIEDAAPAIGSTCRGRKVGTAGHFGCFSFQGAKLLVTGEGGMLVTNSEKLHNRAKRIADQGRVPGTFWIEEIGYKYKMSNIQAALGLGQLERIESMIAKKRKIFSWYAQGLANIPYIRLVCAPEWGTSIYWMTTIILEEGAPFNANELQTLLREKNIDSRPIFPQVSTYPMWREADCPQAASLAGSGLNLPSGLTLQKESIDYICDTLRSF